MLALGASRDPEFLELLSAALKDGETVFLGAASLEAARKTMSEVSFHLAVVDADLEDGCGVVLAATLAIHFPDVAVVAVVPEGDEVSRRRLERLGIHRVLQRPVEADSVAREALESFRQDRTPELTDFSPISPEELEVLVELHADEPDDDHRQWLLGFSYYRLRRHKEALPLLENASRSRPEDADRLYYLGSCHYKLENVAAATNFWTQVVLLDKEGSLARKARSHLDRIER